MSLGHSQAHAQASDPVKRGGFMVPKVAALRATTEAEAQANAVWNLRAALNVAALQCQFSPYLRTVKTYNEFLRQHGRELTRAQTVLLGHFRRHDGPRGANSFDQYTTRTYNSFSTLDAQYSFCKTAGEVGRLVMFLPRGGLGSGATEFNSALRASLTEQPRPSLYEIRPLQPLVIAEIEPFKEEKRRRR